MTQPDPSPTLLVAMTVAGENAGMHTATYSAPSGDGVL